MNEAHLIQELDALPQKDKYQFIMDTLAANPNFLRFKNRLVNLHIANNEMDKARGLLQKEIHNGYNLMFLLTLIDLELRCNNLIPVEKYLDIIQKNNPNNPQSYILRARLSNKQGKKDAVIFNYKKAISLNKLSVGANANLFDIFLNENKLKEAESIINKVLEFKPKEFHFLLRKGKLSLAKDQYDKAIYFFEFAMENSKNNTQVDSALLNIAQAHQAFLNEKSVIEKLQKLIATYPNGLALKFQLLNLKLKSSHFEEAHEIADEILKTHSHHTNGLSRKATIYSRQGLNKQAEVICDDILARSANHLPTMLLKANLLKAKEEMQQAYEIYQKAILSHPSNPWPYHGLGQLVFQEGEIEEALTILEEGIGSVQNAAPLRMKKIQICMHIGKYQEAMEAIKVQSQKEKFKPQTQFLKAQIFQRQGKFLNAKSALEDLKDRCANKTEWVNRANQLLSAIAYQEYDYITAEILLTDLVERIDNPNMPRNRLALLYLLKGDLDAALLQLKTATKEVEENDISGKVYIPLIGHTAKVINDININPRLKNKAIKSFQLEGQKRIQYLSKHTLQHPNYFGFALYLSNELRSQGYFKSLSSSLSKYKKNNSIPKSIIQYWNTTEIPSSVRSVMSSWHEMNPGYVHKIFSRKSAYAFIKIHIGRQEAEAFRNCEHPAMQADFFRLAYLSKNGGYYADADDKCIKSLEQLTNCGAELIVKLGDFGCISNNFLACNPNNDVITNAFRQGVENMLNYYNEGPWFKLGPGHITKCFTNYLAAYVEESDFSKWPRIKVIDQIETRNFLSQHLSLPYKTSNKSWFTAEYKRQISKRKSA